MCCAGIDDGIVFLPVKYRNEITLELDVETNKIPDYMNSNSPILQQSLSALQMQM